MIKRKKDKKLKDINTVNNQGTSLLETNITSDLDFYNNFMRKRGQPVLDEKQYKELLKEQASFKELVKQNRDAINSNEGDS